MLLWIKALLYMVVVGGGWLLVLPLGLLRWEGRKLALRKGTWPWIGGGLLSAGLGLALWAGYHLISRGQGTPLPFDPTRRLVTSGPYRYVRNPQGIAMISMILGEILLLESRRLWLLLPLTLLYLEGLVGPVEERQLLRRHGSVYLAYRRRVSKWRPRFRF